MKILTLSLLVLSINSSIFACTPCTPWSCPPDACEHNAIKNEIDLNNIGNIRDNIKNIHEDIKDNNSKKEKSDV